MTGRKGFDVAPWMDRLGGFIERHPARWIKLGGVADLITLMVVDAQGGLSRLVVEREVSPWQSREIEAVGMKNISFAEMTFDNVRVPKENLLGNAGAGAEQFHRGIESSRAFIGILAVGIAHYALDIAMGYAKDRIAMGRPIETGPVSSGRTRAAADQTVVSVGP